MKNHFQGFCSFQYSQNNKIESSMAKNKMANVVKNDSINYTR